MKSLLIILVLALLQGCSSMADGMSKMAGLGVVKESVSTFDGSKTIEVSPTFLYVEGSWGNTVKLGAIWNSSTPDLVGLVMEQSSSTSSIGRAYIGLQGIDINIDGEIVSYAANSPTKMSNSGYNTVSKTIYTSSRNAVLVPYDVFVKMLEAKDCRIRIKTSEGYEDSLFSTERIPGGQGTAILALREFRVKVDATKN